MRDLLRKRSQLVRQRTMNILSFKNLGVHMSSNEIKRLLFVCLLTKGLLMGDPIFISTGNISIFIIEVSIPRTVYIFSKTSIPQNIRGAKSSNSACFNPANGLHLFKDPELKENLEREIKSLFSIPR
ncbi:MAG: hypothetical protein AB1478_05465, partial [Nitrospirota bacterium]